MIDNMQQFNDEKLQNMLSSMRIKAPDGLKGSVMERVMVYKPKRSPLFWLAPSAGVLGLALVIIISMGIFTNNTDMGGTVADANIPAAEVMMMDAESEGSADLDTSAARSVSSDETVRDEKELAKSSVPASPATTRVPNAVYAREEVPIGGITTPTPSGYSTVNLSGKIKNGQSQTVMLISGLQDSKHWNKIVVELNKISDPFIRTDNYGNFIVDVGIFEESIELFDEKVSSQLSYPEKTDKGSVLFRVEVYK